MTSMVLATSMHVTAPADACLRLHVKIKKMWLIVIGGPIFVVVYYLPSSAKGRRLNRGYVGTGY